MRYIKAIIEAELVTLQEVQKHSDKAHFRQRSLAIELSFRGKTVTLWRKMKYEWLKPADYLYCDTLANAVRNLFVRIPLILTSVFLEKLWRLFYSTYLQLNNNVLLKKNSN